MSRILLTAMKRQLLSPSKVKGTGRVLKDSSGYRIPAVSKYIVKVQPYNPLLHNIGILLRLPMKYIAKSTKSNRMNRYMKGTIIRVRRLVESEQYEKAGKIVWFNMKHSISFRVSAFNKVLSGWYYDTHYKELGKLNRKIDKLLYNKSAELELKRVSIKKSNGKLRPLGVPSKEGRVVLHMLNNFLVELERNQLGLNQHGYVPNKGTMSAGKSVINKINKKYIFETDLKGFFDNVSIGKVVDIVRDQCVETSKGIIRLCKQIPKFKNEKEVEPKYKPVIPKHNPSDGINMKTYSKQEIIGHVFRYMNWGNRELPNKQSVKGLNFGVVPGGFPQGMPLSPFLSILILKEYLGQEESVNYADDQIFFSDEKMEIIDDKDKGIIHSPEKCQGIKVNGEWLVDSFKFLGFRLYKNNKGLSETRNGVKEGINPKIAKLYTNEGLKKLKGVKSESQLMQLSKGLDVTEPLDINQMESLKNITQKSLFGFIISCMSIGDWENNHSLLDRKKAHETMYGKLHLSSLLGRIPNNIDSSKCIPHLAGIIKKIIKKHSSKKQKK